MCISISFDRITSLFVILSSSGVYVDIDIDIQYQGKEREKNQSKLISLLYIQVKSANSSMC